MTYEQQQSDFMTSIQKEESEIQAFEDNGDLLKLNHVVDSEVSIISGQSNYKKESQKSFN